MPRKVFTATKRKVAIPIGSSAIGISAIRTGTYDLSV